MLKFKLIGVYQLITGIFGSILVLFNFGFVLHNSEVFPYFLIALTLFAGTAIAGYFLLMGNKKAVGYSIVSQAFQSIAFIFSGSQYLFTCAAFFAVAFNAQGIHFESKLTPIAYQINTVLTSAAIDIKLFLVPLFFIFLLSWNKK
jgi:hypothetical protein